MKAPRRIVYDGRYIAPHFPGVGRYALGCLDALARALPGTEFVVLRNEWTSALPQLPNVTPRLVRAVPLSASANARLWAELRGLHGDLFHIPHFPVPWGLSMPVVSTIHDLIPLDFPDSMPSRLRRLVFDWEVRRSVSASARVLAPSKATMERLRRRYGQTAAAKTVVTSEGVNPHFRPQPDETACLRMREALGFPAGYVLHVGGNRPHKNTLRLVEAFARADLAMGLVFAGSFDVRFPSPIVRANELGLNGRIRHLGIVPEQDLPDIYAAATFVAAPSLCEGFGLPLAEALACGTPVLCHHAAALSEVAGGAAYLTDCANPDAFAAAMRRLASDASVRRDLRARGLTRAAGLTWDGVAARIIAGAYRPLLGG